MSQVHQVRRGVAEIPVALDGPIDLISPIGGPDQLTRLCHQRDAGPRGYDGLRAYQGAADEPAAGRRLSAVRVLGADRLGIADER